MRSKAPPVVDKSHFTNSATRTKAVNLRQVIFRGGMRF